MSEISVSYVRGDNPNILSVITINSSFTFGQLLDAINKKKDANYQYVWFDNSMCESKDIVVEFIKDPSNKVYVTNIPYPPPIYEEKPKNTQTECPSIKTESYTLPPTTPGKLRLFCTATPDLFLNGIEFDPDFNWTPNACSDFILNLIKDKITIDKPQLLLYLPGGIPFTAGTLGDFFKAEVITVPNIIYGVLTRNIADALLDKELLELCNISDANRKQLLSPTCDSTVRGLADIACLLGYLNHDGYYSIHLLKRLATITHFTPLIIEMNRIIEDECIVGRTIVTVAGALFCYFQYMLPETIALDHIFEYSLRCCNIISLVNNYPYMLPISTIRLSNSENPAVEIFIKLNQPPIFYFWNCDSDKEFPYQNLCKPEMKAIEEINKYISWFRPTQPLTIRFATGVSIVQGKDHSFLFLTQSMMKGALSQDIVDIIDPLIGFAEAKNVYEFAREQEITQNDNTTSNIDPDRVKQLIMVCLDMSGSMIGDIEGYAIRDYKDKDNRVTMAHQYLSTLASKIQGYRIPTIQGLISFNSEVKVRCPLTPVISDFEDKGLKDIFPESTTHLWDAILKACDDLIAFNKVVDGKKTYCNAVSRILVISDGDDYGSTAKHEEVAKKLLDNKIIVDSVVISADECCKLLCALSHITGGLSFRPQTFGEGLALFEQSAFTNYEERVISPKPVIGNELNTIAASIRPEMIDAEFMNKAGENAVFDTEIVNKDIANARTNAPLAQPCHVIYKNCHKSNKRFMKREIRIMKELLIAIQVNDIQNIRDYDPDIKIYTSQAAFDKWCVFIKGSDDTEYANKWWHLIVTFPELYPVEPPIFRFITVPYHLNVSPDGKICLNIHEKGYLSSNNVADMIQEIKELFLLPCESTPIHLEAFEVYRFNRAEYKKLAKESAEKNAKSTVEEYIESITIINKTPSDFQICDYINRTPGGFRSPISGKSLKYENIVISSSGVNYDKDELNKLISSNSKPICFITGKTLSEKIRDD